MNQNSIPYPIEFVLRVIGIWPGVSHFSVYILIFLLFTFCFIFQVWNAILVYRNLILLMSSICATTAEVMFFMKFVTLRKKRRFVTNVLIDIINDCKILKTERERNIILGALKFSHSFFIYTTALYLSAGGFFIIAGAVTYRTENREFILASTFPFEAQKSPVFEIIFVIHFFAVVIATFGNAFLDGVFIMMVRHAGAKIDMVRDEIARFSKIGRVSENKRLLKWATKILIDKYQEAIEFTPKIEYIFSYQLLVQVLLSTLEICATGFTFISLTEDNSGEHVASTKTMKFMVILIAGLWITGVYCTGGDYLLNKNELIQRDIYSCLWYKLRPTECKTLFIIMIRSQRPMTITAGKFMNLTIDSYTKILKTSLSYLSVLRAIH